MDLSPLTQTTVCQLPPLILHPFTDPGGPAKLVRSSRANLMLQGLIPAAGESTAELTEAMLEGRYCEVRMLCYVGKDVDRWIEQCLDQVSRNELLCTQDFRYQSFARYLIEHAPARVVEKLCKWGVGDYSAIFRRGIGLSAVFSDAPDRDMVSEEFLEHYHHYADVLFEGRMNRRPYVHLDPDSFDFQLYASGEYTRLLERSWQEE